MIRAIFPAAVVLLAACAASTPRDVPVQGSTAAPADTSRVYLVDDLPEGDKPLLSNRTTVAMQMERSSRARPNRSVAGGATVRFVVERTEEPSSLEVIRSTSPEFEAAALQVARVMRFRPGRLDGVPVRVRVTVPLSFNSGP